MTLLQLIEEQFADGGRTPKGQRTRRAIFRATREIVAEEGLQGASLDMIAGRAGLTQAALRHHFPTRDELLTSYFVTASEVFRNKTSGLLADANLSAADRLRSCIDWHLEFMEGVDTIYWLEASAYWLRHKASRHTRDTWYAWLTCEYARLIGEMQPALGQHQCHGRAYAILSMLLGAWITHGRGSATWNGISVGARRQVLVDAAVAMATR